MYRAALHSWVNSDAGRLLRLGAVWIVFAGAMCAAGWSMPAWDLSAGYIAGRLVARGQGAHIYDQAMGNTMDDAGSAWAQAAVSGGITDGVVTPYIQTPIYAWLVAPLAGRVGFAAFRHVFLILAAMATAGLVWLSTWHWAPELAGPGWQAGLLAGLFLSVPNEVAVALGQTHIYFILLAVLAIMAGQRGRPVAAGGLLAMAAAVKISPGWVAVAWLAAGDWRAVGSFAGFSAGLAGLALLVDGWAGMAAFAHGLGRTGSEVTLAFNNDSLASVLMGGALNQRTAFHDFMRPMPGWVGVFSALALVGVCAGAGRLDRARGWARGVGPVVALVGATAFSPLAWNHYFIVLVVPVVLMLGAMRRSGARGWAAAAGAVVVLNYPPLAYGIGAAVWVVALRSEFWAALLCVCALPFLPRFAAEPAVGRSR